MLTGPLDPFASSTNHNAADTTKPTFQRTNKIHLRLQKRGNRKWLTIIEGLDNDLDENRICRHMRRTFNCNGAVLKNDDDEPILQLQGDQRQNIKDWFILQEILTEKEAKERLVVHGA